MNTETEKTTIDKIKEAYPALNDKMGFIKGVAEKVEKKPLYLKQHWFREFWAIPEAYQETVLQILEETVAIQKQAS